MSSRDENENNEKLMLSKDENKNENDKSLMSSNDDDDKI